MRNFATSNLRSKSTSWLHCRLVERNIRKLQIELISIGSSMSIHWYTMFESVCMSWKMIWYVVLFYLLLYDLLTCHERKLRISRWHDPIPPGLDAIPEALSRCQGLAAHWNEIGTANWHTLASRFSMVFPYGCVVFSKCQTYYIIYYCMQVSRPEVEPAKGRCHCGLPNIPTSAEFFLAKMGLVLPS